MSNSTGPTALVTLGARATPTESSFTPVVGESTAGLLTFLTGAEIILPSAAPRVRGEALRILADCAPPHASRASRIGLVCGYVQSGKTVSIETVAALAKDNGYRIVVLLAGVTTN